jgi:hypothetical protein
MASACTDPLPYMVRCARCGANPRSGLVATSSGHHMGHQVLYLGNALLATDHGDGPTSSGLGQESPERALDGSNWGPEHRHHELEFAYRVPSVSPGSFGVNTFLSLSCLDPRAVRGVVVCDVGAKLGQLSRREEHPFHAGNLLDSGYAT